MLGPGTSDEEDLWGHGTTSTSCSARGASVIAAGPNPWPRVRRRAPGPSSTPRTILARFRWLDTDSPHPRWEQDFSFDDGSTWEPVNWVMTHTRIR